MYFELLCVLPSLKKQNLFKAYLHCNDLNPSSWAPIWILHPLADDDGLEEIGGAQEGEGVVHRLLYIVR